MVKKKTNKKQNETVKVNQALTLLLIVVLAGSAYLLFSSPESASSEQEMKNAVGVKVTFLGVDCEDCIDVAAVRDFLSQQSSITVDETVELTIEESRELIAEHNISRLPAVLLEGDVKGVIIESFTQSNEALLLGNMPPPYYDIASEKVKGLVSVKHVTVDCRECFDMDIVLDGLSQAGIVVKDVLEVNSKSDEGKELVEQYKLEKLPTLIFSSDAAEYDAFAQVWQQVGTEEEDGSLVLRLVSPPYVNVATKKVEGKVKATYLVDAGCTSCFDPHELDVLLNESFGMFIDQRKDVDIMSSAGKTLVNKYNIDFAPTVVLSKDAGLYPMFEEGWAQAGTKETDGMFVFRAVNLLEPFLKQKGVYFSYVNASSGQLITTASPDSIIEVELPMNNSLS